jgi:hypothetical protein
LRRCSKTVDELTAKKIQRESKQRNAQEKVKELADTIAADERRHKEIIREIKQLNVEGDEIDAWKEFVSNGNVSQDSIDQAIQKGKKELHNHESVQILAKEYAGLSGTYTDMAKSEACCPVCKRDFKDDAEISSFFELMAEEKRKHSDANVRKKIEADLARCKKEVDAMNQANVKFAQV